MLTPAIRNPESATTSSFALYPSPCPSLPLPPSLQCFYKPKRKQSVSSIRAGPEVSHPQIAKPQIARPRQTITQTFGEIGSSTMSIPMTM
ncbi:unnamed protein product [Prunus armeniaca]